MTRALLMTAMLLLAGCGSVTRLRPTGDMTPVPKAAAADRIETAAELMTPSTQAQPDRQADLLAKSAVRKDDPFALPPGPQSGQPAFRSGGASAVPQPTNTAQDRNETGQGLPETIDANDDTPDDPNAPAPTPVPDKTPDSAPGNSSQ